MKLHTAVVVSLALICSACATQNVVLTSASQENREAATQHQRAADTFRREGASDAAAHAQGRADEKLVAANKKPDSVGEWLIDTLFLSWLNSGSGNSTARHSIALPAQPRSIPRSAAASMTSSHSLCSATLHSAQIAPPHLPASSSQPHAWR